MTSVSIVAGNPNPNAVTCLISRDLLAPRFSKVVFPRPKLGAPPGLERFSRGFISRIFRERGAISRIDVISRPDNKSLITLVQSLGPFGPGGQQKAAGEVEAILRATNMPIDLEELKKNVTPIKPFNPGTDQVKGVVAATIRKRVSPDLVKDGGDIEILDITLSHNALEVRVALLGSCQGCGNAVGATLKNAGNDITTVVGVIKARSPAYKDLSFKGITTVDVPNFVLGIA